MSRLKHRQLQKPPPAKIAFEDKIKLAVLLFLMFGVPIVVPYCRAIRRRDESVSRLIDEWKVSYHLSNVQADRIREIELHFHHAEGFFSYQPDPSSEEIHRHHIEISEQMSPDDAKRYLEATESGNGAGG